MSDFTPEEEYCHCGDLRDFPHTCGEKPMKFVATGKLNITLPTDVPIGFKIEIPANENGIVINIPAYQQIRRR